MKVRFDVYRQRLVSFYQKHAPEKLSAAERPIDAILERIWSGQTTVGTIFRKLRAKYHEATPQFPTPIDAGVTQVR